MDDGAKSNFGVHKEFTVLNFLKYKYNVNKSRGVPRDYLAKIVSYLPVGGWFRNWKKSSNNTFSNICSKYF